jgi:hypothetical protein
LITAENSSKVSGSLSAIFALQCFPCASQLRQ